MAEDVWGIVKNLFGGAAPPVDLPIYCHRISGPRPVTVLDNDWAHSSKIVVSLTANGPVYDQFAYQLAHELAHVMLNPHRSNGVVEAICTAASYEVLDRMSDKWEMVVPFSYMRGYEENFRKYRREQETTPLARLPEISDAAKRGHWLQVRQYLYTHRSEQNGLTQPDIVSEHERDIEALVYAL